MANVHIDISLFTTDTAYGKVSGTLEVAVIPQVGDVIAFRLTEPTNAHVGARKLPYVGHLRVTDRVIPAEPESEVLIVLEDIMAVTADDANKLMEMFDREHRLSGDVWDE